MEIVIGGIVTPEQEDKIRAFARIFKETSKSVEEALIVVDNCFVNGNWPKFATTNTEEDRLRVREIVIDEMSK